jgi:hypothetical protein
MNEERGTSKMSMLDEAKLKREIFLKLNVFVAPEYRSAWADAVAQEIVNLVKEDIR